MVPLPSDDAHWRPGRLTTYYDHVLHTTLYYVTRGHLRGAGSEVAVVRLVPCVDVRIRGYYLV